MDDYRLMFKTDYFLDDIFDSGHASTFFEIKPYEDSWDLLKVTAFLNEMVNFKKSKYNPFRKEGDLFATKLSFSFEHKDSVLHKIFVNVSTDCSKALNSQHT